MSPTTSTVITVCYNSEKTIARTIESVLNQSHPVDQYLIIDGCSTDRTGEIVNGYLQQFHGRLEFYSSTDTGMYDAMNKGIKKARGNIIGILNSDDCYTTNAIDDVMQAFEQMPQCHVIAGKKQDFDRQGKPYKICDNVRAINQKTIFKRMPLNHPATFVRRQIYENLGGFDTSFRLSSDYEFIARCVFASCRFGFVETVLTHMHMVGATSQLKNLFVSANEDCRLRKRYGDKLRVIRYFRRCCEIVYLSGRRLLGGR